MAELECWNCGTSLDALPRPITRFFAIQAIRERIIEAGKGVEGQEAKGDVSPPLLRTPASAGENQGTNGVTLCEGPL